MNKLKPILGRLPNFQHIDRRGLVLDLPMNEGYGDKVQDYHTPSWGLSNNGTNNGAEWVAGPDGPVLRFDGNTSAVNAGNKSIFDTREFTFEAYLKTNDASEEQLIVSKGDSTNQGYFIKLLNTGKLLLSTRDGGGNSLTRSNSTTAFSDGNYHHFVATVKLGGLGSFYIDGVKLANDVFDNHTNWDEGTSRDYIIGSFFNETISWNGDIAYARHYIRILSEAEIKSLSDNPWQAWQRDNIALWAAAQAAPVTGIPILRRRRECA